MVTTQRCTLKDVDAEKAIYNYTKSDRQKVCIKSCRNRGSFDLYAHRGAQIFEAVGLNKSLVDNISVAPFQR